ncbi:MAG: hypothetical protein M3507_00730 [Actinomycetota bacterium]|nr:hypothetical protein [Actinomycetota bacterium]
MATVAYGPIALCDTCDRMRSAVGREHVARPLPGAQLDRLSQAVASLRNAEQALDLAVAAARHEGASWAQIGDIVAITRQAAHQRWASREGSEGALEGRTSTSPPQLSAPTS